MVLRSAVPLLAQNKEIGRLVFDLATPQLNVSLFNASLLGKNGEMGACVVKNAVLLCFPGSRHDAPFTVTPRATSGHPLPVEYALAGKSGIVYTLDYRGQNVIAAYIPLAPGLGYEAKQDTKEAYAVIRSALEIGTPIILLVALLGSALLYSQLHPLATRMHESELALSKLARYDSLTGLPNRFLFMDMLRTALLRNKRSPNAMALMFLDLDGFKQVNDSMGHAAGDQLLIQFAQRLSSLVRRTDAVARLAGDEFTIILEELVRPEEDVQAIANKILASVQQPFLIAGQSAHVSASIGIVIHRASTEDVDVTQLLHRADQGMYAAKQAGKNTYKVA
jgi:diguanylate cyclase (GGDEF)-like protein